MLTSAPTAESLQPGTKFQFADFDELHGFEADLAPIVDASHVSAYWERRQQFGHELVQLLRRQNNGVNSPKHPTFTVIADAYDRLQTSRQDGWQIGRPIPKRTDGTEDLFQGFVLDADAYSNRLRQAGRLEAMVWYAPVAGNREVSPRSRDKYSSGILRIIAHPKFFPNEPATRTI